MIPPTLEQVEQYMKENNLVTCQDLPDEFEIRVDDLDVLKATKKELRLRTKQLYEFQKIMLSFGYKIFEYRPLQLPHTIVWKFVRDEDTNII